MIPKQYQFLLKLELPKIVAEALKLYGSVEVPGNANNPVIMAWAKELGIDRDYTADSIPWCGLFMAIIAKRAGKEVVKSPLWALNWGTFGLKTTSPKLGDVLTFVRNGGGHVALYIGETKTTYHVLGGNQSDKVCFTEIAKNRLYQARTPEYKVGAPASAKQYFLDNSGAVSTNEA